MTRLSPQAPDGGAVFYRHRQVGRLLRAALLGGALALFVAAWRSPAAQPGAGAGAVALLAAAALFSTLTVEVTPGEIVAWFGPVRVIRRRVRTSEVRSARSVRNRWYYGWGIRLTPSGWMFNVEGLDAVELDLAGNRRFRIGTDDPAGLLGALREAGTETS